MDKLRDYALEVEYFKFYAQAAVEAITRRNALVTQVYKLKRQQDLLVEEPPSGDRDYKLTELQQKIHAVEAVLAETEQDIRSEKSAF